VIARGDARLWVQAELVRRGLARVYSLPDTSACVRQLEALEETARTQELGLWRDPKTAIAPAWQTRRLTAHRNEFVIVEGSVRAVAATRNWTFLNFGSNWRKDFTVAIASSDRRRFDGSDIALDALEGAQVRVRGWIERWNGPVIKATHPEQIEVLEAAERHEEK
jgi:hypothetical protein